MHEPTPPPPTYESAVSRDVWVLVAPHTLSSRTRINDLYSACLVSKRWHEIFIPYLWGDPASHFEDEEAEMGSARERDFCDSLSRFRHIIRIARFSVRKHTHTLRLPPARSEIYGAPKQTWLRDIIEYLPNIQALFVSKLLFFDHHSLMALKGGYSSGSNGLRLLCAENEANATSAALVEGLNHFRKLVYLDLSYTATARDPTVLNALGGLEDLLVLKLKGVRMRDQHLEVLVGAIGVRVRVLDLRDNLVTDDGVRGLLSGSFLTGNEEAVGFSGVGGLAEGAIRVGQDEILSSQRLTDEDLDEKLVDQLRRPSEKQPAFEYLPHSGITHLFISENRLSGKGLADLLAAKRLCVLDSGSVDIGESMVKGSEPVSAGVSLARRAIPILVTSAGKCLTYLRLSHSVVTEDAPIMEVSGSTGGLESQFAASQISERPRPEQDTDQAQSGRLSPSASRERKIKQLLSKRPNPSAVLQQSVKSRSLHLHPSHIPNVTTLVLTDIPSSVPASSNIVPSLINFISSCADETHLATLQSQSNYSLPPGRFRASAERRHAKSLFRLQRIVLEIAPVTTTKSDPRRKQTTGWNPEYYHNPAFLKSSTGDQDSERLWAAAANDFTFFGDGDEEEDGAAGGRGSVLVSEEADYEEKKVREARRNADLDEVTGPRVDVVAALAEFRRKKRRGFEELVDRRRRGGPGHSTLPVTVEGHWEGEVKVIRDVAAV